MGEQVQAMTDFGLVVVSEGEQGLASATLDGKPIPLRDEAGNELRFEELAAKVGGGLPFQTSIGATIKAIPSKERDRG